MSSLFGNVGASSQPKPSLFGNTTSASQAAPLFGSLNQPAQPTTSLFGSTTQAPAQQQTGTSLFGATLQTPQQTGTSLFGAAPTSQPQQQQSGTSLFGATNTTQTQQQTSASLFGGGSALSGATPNASQAQPQNSGSQIGGPSTAQQPTKSGSYFDSILEKSRKRAFGETALEDLPSLQLGLGDLRQRIKKLAPAAQDRVENGRAHYLLAASGVEPGSTIRDLSYFDTYTAKVDKPQPTPLSDTDVEGYIANLQTQTTLSMISEALSRSARDFDTFLEENVAMEWDAQRKRIYEHFGIKPRTVETGHRSGVSFGAPGADDRGGFGRSRRSKAQAGGTRASGAPNESAFGRSGFQKSVIGSAGPINTGHRPSFVDVETKGQPATSSTVLGSDDRFVREKQSKFADKVQELNAARLRKASFPLFQEFSDAESQSSDPHVPDVINAYKGMMEILGEDGENTGSNTKERQFAEAYLEDAHQSAKGIELRKRILRGSTRHLERRFFQDLEDLVKKNPREANLGGVPNVLSKVKAYIRLRAIRKDLAPEGSNLQSIDEEYAWAIVFYLLRSGHLREAAEYVRANVIAFRTLDRNFVNYIKNYADSPDRRLSREYQDRINIEYTQRVRNAPKDSIDPFRMACYKVIGRCELGNRNLNGLIPSLDDYIWLQFNLAREVNPMEEIASDVFSLENVQEGIKQLGAKYFSKTDQNTGFGMFFYLQILAGLFESAIQFLYNFQHIDATHFAITLDYYGLLRVSDLSVSGAELLTHDTRGRPQINFAQMVGWYTRDFRAANVVAAVDYLTLICLNSDLPGDAGRQQTSVCHQGLRELVLESREFAKLLGDMRLDGQRIRGAIEERMRLIGLDNTDDFMRTVTIQAASIADDNGRTTDAVLLYHLAGDYNNVISIVNRALSEAIAVDIGQQKMSLLPLRPRTEELTLEQQQSSSLSLTSIDDPIKLAQTIYSIYANNVMYYEQITQNNQEACLILLKINGAKTRMEEGRWTDVLDAVGEIKILPLDARGDSTLVRQSAAKYSSFPETITRNIPNLIIWTIRSCSQQRAILANSQYGSNEGTRLQLINDLKTKAKDLMMYVGFLKYRLPASVNDTLARIAAE